MSQTYEQAKDAMILVKNTLDTAAQKLQSSFASYKVSVSTDGEFRGAVRDADRQADARDQDFWEEKQLYGDEGVSTQLNLQKITLYIYVGALAFLGIALAVHRFVSTQNLGEVLKALGIYAFIVFIQFALILRYA